MEQELWLIPKNYRSAHLHTTRADGEILLFLSGEIFTFIDYVEDFMLVRKETVN